MQDRKTKILDSAITLLAHRGLSQLTHRAVDTAAGLPQGSTTYYFPKKIQLIESSATRLAELIEDDCIAVKARFAELIAKGDQDGAINFVADDLLTFAQEHSDWLLARFELTLAGARDPELRPTVERLSRAAQEPIAFFLKLLVDDVSDEQIDWCKGILDGLSLVYATGQGPPATREQIKRLFLTV